MPIYQQAQVLGLVELACPVVVGAYVDDLKKLLDGSSIMERRVFLRSLVKGVSVGKTDVTTRYLMPLPTRQMAGLKPKKRWFYLSNKVAPRVGFEPTT